jgi:NADH-quinone oxidoreductase subunit C
VSPEDALARVQEAVGERASEYEVNHGDVELTCLPKDFHVVARTLRDAEGIRCKFFTFLSAVDRTEVTDNPGGLEVLLHVYSPEHVISVNVHVPVDLENPTCTSITDIYLGALWHERECCEMYGIHFEGHPKLVNLYLPEDFEGHPGLRSFKLPSRHVKEWPGAKDPEEAAAGGR